MWPLFSVICVLAQHQSDGNMHFLESSLAGGCSSTLSSESSPLPTEDPSERGSCGVTMTFQLMANAFKILTTTFLLEMMSLPVFLNRSPGKLPSRRRSKTTLQLVKAAVLVGVGSTHAVKVTFSLSYLDVS